MDNREKLIELMNKSGITRQDAANYIAAETKRPCSWRAIQSWVADPDRASARPCPDWAVVNLEKKLKKLRLIVDAA
jgi:hypothetical protein